MERSAFRVAALGAVLSTGVAPMSATGQSDSAPSWTEVDGIPIAFESHGAGPALVFVHGWTADRSHWHRQVEAFDGFRVLTLDLPGHGESGAPERDYPVRLFARAVEAVMDAAEVDSAVLVGHSNGVMVVRDLYRLAPSRVRALVGVDGWLRSPLAPGMLEWMRRMAESPQYETMMRQMVEQTPYGELGPDDVALVKRASLATPIHVQRAGVDMMADPATWSPDPIDVPLLLVHAASSQLTPDYEPFVRELAPHVEIHVWEGVSHFIPLERPDELNALIRALLERMTAG